MVRPFLCLYLICSWMDTRLLGDGGGTIKKKKKKKEWFDSLKTKQNELYEYFNSRGMSKICNYPCVWICATLFPACHSPDSLSLPSRLRLSVVGKWVKCCSGLHDQSLVSLAQMKHFSPIWCTYLRIQAKSLKASVQWSRVEFGL